MFHTSNFSNVKHAFHSRNGGASTGNFASMNLALDKGDSIENIKQNRKILFQLLDLKKLLTFDQVHGTDVVIVNKPWDFLDPDTPKADAIICQIPGIAIGILTADCVPVLIHDPVTKTIAAVHAGWKGTLKGVIARTIDEMKNLGCKPQDLKCAIGPCIQQNNYEVSQELYNDFTAQNYENFFKPSVKHNHYMFDLPGVVEHQLNNQNVGYIDNTQICTYADPKNYFSCRRAAHKGESSFGCQISVIIL